MGLPAAPSMMTETYRCCRASMHTCCGTAKQHLALCALWALRMSRQFLTTLISLKDKAETEISQKENTKAIIIQVHKK